MNRFQNSWLRPHWVVLLVIVAGCGGGSSVAPVTAFDAYGGQDYHQIQFKDDVKTNASTDSGIAELTFTDINGETYSLADSRGKKHVVLVITRGFAGSVCLYCATQTSRLLTNYKKFGERDAEVVIVFPIQTSDDSQRHRDFAVSVKNKLDTPPEKIPFPIVLDVELKAVDQLGIRKDLSKPATYIIDKEGQVRFAYVGESLADRPSVKVLLEQLDGLNKP
ncbi:MAG: redoxin domain-containing protein [Planctomycetia bacterium]|nr:redoxin domain-containing protein [Planctomycetia bacterium]